MRRTFIAIAITLAGASFAEIRPNKDSFTGEAHYQYIAWLTQLHRLDAFIAEVVSNDGLTAEVKLKWFFYFGPEENRGPYNKIYFKKEGEVSETNKPVIKELTGLKPLECGFDYVMADPPPGYPWDKEGLNMAYLTLDVTPDAFYEIFLNGEVVFRVTGKGNPIDFSLSGEQIEELRSYYDIYIAKTKGQGIRGKPSDQ